MSASNIEKEGVDFRPSSEDDRRVKSIVRAILGAEVLFALLPLLVYVVVYASNNKLCKLPEIAEWAFSACILYGLTIVRFATGVISNHRYSPEKIGFVISGLIVLGLVPSSLILCLILQSEPQVPTTLIALQMVMLVLSIVAFFAFAGAGLYNVVRARKGRQ